MEYTPTQAPVFIGIVLGFTTVIFLFLGAKKAFFEPYTGPDES